jgi:hypothetical protein
LNEGQDYNPNENDDVGNDEVTLLNSQDDTDSFEVSKKRDRADSEKESPLTKSKKAYKPLKKEG